MPATWAMLLIGLDHGDENRCSASPGKLPPLARVDHSGPMRGELRLETAPMLQRVFNRMDPFLKDDLLGSTVEPLIAKPAPMRQSPVATTVNPAVPQQEGRSRWRFRRRS
jgi:hypothetical protein